MKINPNDPAYPVTVTVNTPPSMLPVPPATYTGIPIRLAVAAQMMAGFASWSGSREATPDYIPIEKASKCALQWADALIAEYNKSRIA